jgi:hypothetical protein
MRASAVLMRTLLALGLSGCGVRDAGELSQDGFAFITMPARALYAWRGPPVETRYSPSGATIYFYEARDVVGNPLCRVAFYVRDHTIVGVSSRGWVWTCAGGAIGQVD